LQFEFPEDEECLRKLLREPNEDIDKYELLFDFRSHIVKRKEFNHQYGHLLSILHEQYGTACQLQCSCVCRIRTGVVVDHLLPLRTNELNKKLRHLSAPLVNKVSSQSFGSNHPNNLVIASYSCNNHKKHRFLPRDAMKRILHIKGL
jgi:hypothetical protein